MSRFPTDETICIDNCICVYCGNKFDGQRACNSNMDCNIVICPKCNKEMYVSLSIEYVCSVIED